MSATGAKLGRAGVRPCRTRPRRRAAARRVGVASAAAATAFAASVVCTPATRRRAARTFGVRDRRRRARSSRRSARAVTLHLEHRPGAVAGAAVALRAIFSSSVPNDGAHRRLHPFDVAQPKLDSGCGWRTTARMPVMSGWAGFAPVQTHFVQAARAGRCRPS